MKIALVAGSGDLPKYVIHGAQAAGHELYVAALDGFERPSELDIDCDDFGIAEFGKMTKSFKAKNCSHVCFAGNVNRPDFKTIRPDWKAIKHVPGALKAARKGDDALLSYILKTFEEDGFEIVPPQDIASELLLPEGHLGSIRMTSEHRDDVEKACKIAQNIGSLDIGQGTVVCRGLVLAVEAQEGTDAMLSRVAELPENIRGSVNARMGVLSKMVKPGQESRVDLPTIGPKTIELASEAGLAGIAAEAGRCFVIDRDSVIEAANEAGIFVIGIPT